MYFLGRKRGRCVRLTNLPTFCAVFMKSWNHNFLALGPLKACNGTALLLTPSYKQYLSLRHNLYPDKICETFCSFMVTPCINNAEPFYYQLIHIMLKNTELLKHSKLNKNAPTCFVLHRNHLQGAKLSAWLKITHLVNSICVKDVQGVVSAMAAYCDL